MSNHNLSNPVRLNARLRHLLAGFLLAATLLGGILLGAAVVPARADTPPHLGYGMMLAYPPSHLTLAQEAGFDWFKYFTDWNVVDANHDRDYDWDTVDWRLNEACKHQMHLLLRVERDPSNWTPIGDGEMDAWQAFFEDLAAHIGEERAECAFPYRVALEVWNEPNLDFQWGGRAVDPVRYTEMVKRAYAGAKAGDPHILVVAGSLAPTGGLPDGRAMDDVAFLEAMYAAGLQGHFDAIGIHNYGFGGPPEDKEWGYGILNFRRAEDIHAVMVDHGDGDLPVWGTEFGWLLASSACDAYWHQIGFAWQQVTAEQQADYLQRAFAYADEHWPWMGPMIVSNLDFSVMPWYGTCEPLRYFAILNEDKTPRPAYTALAEMAKRPRSWAIGGMAAEPTALTWMQAVSETQVVTRGVTVRNIGEVSFTWRAEVVSDTLPVSIDPSSGASDTSMTVTIDPCGLPLGAYTGTLTITADAPEVPESPLVVPVRVNIVEQIHSVYLPLVQRR